MERNHTPTIKVLRHLAKPGSEFEGLWAEMKAAAILTLKHSTNTNDLRNAMRLLRHDLKYRTEVTHE